MSSLLSTRDGPCDQFGIKASLTSQPKLDTGKIFVCFPSSPSSSLLLPSLSNHRQRSKWSCVSHDSIQIPRQRSPHPQDHSQQHSVPATIHTQTHKETLTVKARNSVGINSPKHRQRGEDSIMGIVCYIQPFIKFLLPALSKKDHQHPLPHSLSVWMLDASLHNLRIFTHSFIHQKWLNESAVSPVSAVREILRQIKNHLCPQGAEVSLQTSKKAIMQCDWTSSTRENKELRKPLGWTLNPGAQRRKVGRWKREGQCIQDQTTSGAHRNWRHKTNIKDFPGSQVVKTPCFQCRGRGFNPWSGS